MSNERIPLDLYQRLSCPEFASREAMKAKYRELVFKFHPDRAGVQSTKKMQEINAAYDFLMQKKEWYDAALRQHRHQPVYQRPTQADINEMESIFNIIIQGFDSHGAWWSSTYTSSGNRTSATGL